MSLFSLWREYRESGGRFTPLGSLYSKGQAEVGKPGSLQVGESSDGKSQASEQLHGGGDPVTKAHEQGIAEGYRRAKEEMSALEGQLGQAVQEFTAFRGALERRYAKQMLGIAVAVAEKILRAELKENPQRWLPMIEEGIRQAVDKENIRIRANPVLYRLLNDQGSRLRQTVEEAKNIELVEDAAVGEVGCVIETKYGDVDVGVPTQVDAAHAALVEHAQ